MDNEATPADGAGALLPDSAAAKETELLNIAPLPWGRDTYGSIVDATGERVELTGIAMATGRISDDALCHGNSELLLAAPALLAYYRASKNLQMTLGNPDATAQDEHEAEAAYAAAASAAASAVGALVLHNARLSRQGGADDA